MSLGNFFSVAGIKFSERFVTEIRSRWQAIVRDNPDAVVDIQRTRRSGEVEPAHDEWSVYFLMGNIFRSEDVYLLQGIPIHFTPEERNLLKGKLLDFENQKIVVQ